MPDPRRAITPVKSPLTQVPPIAPNWKLRAPIVAGLVVTVLLSLLAVPAQSNAAARKGKLVAHKHLKATKGGTVRARNGVKLFVPRKVMRRNGVATIRRVRRGLYDIHIHAPWRGKVAVTLPRGRGSSRLVAHRVAGFWMLQRPGRRSRKVWTSSLSLWTTAQSVIKKLKIAKCLRRPGAASKLICLADSNLDVPFQVLQEILNPFDPSCQQQVFARLGPNPFGDPALDAAVKNLPCVRNGGKTPSASPNLVAPIPQLPYKPQAPVKPVSPPPPPLQPKGFTVEDVFLGGTWARTDPNDGTWYSRGNRPGNGAYWYPNGLGVGVDCARAAAGYVVKFAGGRTEQWNTWFHVTDGKWFPSAAARETRVNGFYGLSGC